MAENLTEGQEPQDEIEFATLEELTQEAEAPANPEPEDTKTEDEIPDKYKGKSPTELIRMHQEAEKLAGRQGNEVGELRKLVDDFITNQSMPPKEQQQETISDVDFLEDPNAAIDKKLANHPSVKKAEEAISQLEKMQNLNAIATAHPDFQDIVADQGFQEWVGASKVRTKMLQNADKNFSFEDADELFTSWKERLEMTKQATEAMQADQQAQLKKGQTGSSRGSGEAPRKKFLKRSEILHMMQYEPERYAANQDIIMQAYAENRVR